MKRFLFALFLLTIATPLFAADEDGNGTMIPSYQELVREGYGPRRDDRVVTTRVDYYSTAFIRTTPKPTQAYYGKGYTIYYGYTPVRIIQGEENERYAFGMPLSYYRQLMGSSIDQTNLSHYVAVVPKNNFEPGTYIAQRPVYHSEAVTTVQSVTAPAATSTATATVPGLPPIAEKPVAR